MFKTKQKIKICVKVSLLLFSLLLVAGNSIAATLTVGNNENNYASIQKAINSASEGDIILVNPGTYVENIKISKSISIRSLSNVSEDTVIRCFSSKDNVVTITADSVNISGFAIIGSKSPCAGIYLNDCQNSIILTNLIRENNIGVYLESSNKNKILGNAIDSNEADGLFLINSTDIIVEGNIIESNDFNGIAQYNCSRDRILNNTVNSNKYNGIFLYNSSENIIGKNTANLNKAGGFSLGNSTKNILQNNVLTENEMYGISLVGSSFNYLLNNNVNLSNTGITLTESSGNQIKNNSVSSIKHNGFLISDSNENTLEDNDLEKSYFGIFLKGSINNTLKNNLILKNSEGIYLQNASGNKLYANEIKSNDYGVDTCECQYNNEYSMNRIKDNRIAFYIDKSNDNITKNNLLENNGKNIVKTEPGEPNKLFSKLVIIGIAFILFIIFIGISLKNKNVK